MALNAVIIRKRWPVSACAAAHASGDFVQEDGKFGVCVETNLINGKNTLMTGRMRLVCPSGVTEGQLLYFLTASLGAGVALQLAPSATTAITATIQTSATSATVIGRAVRAAYAFGASTVTDVELADAT